MKKIVLILALALSMSCGRRPSNFSDGVVITGTEAFTTSDQNGKSVTGCLYYTETTVWHNGIFKITTAYFYDICGKYTVGDTVKTVKL